ncbi:MAG: biopolymer transporter ExbD [Synergistaceae bacterium]|jgi:biopolymer transport protein ExbD|nr:biopolymer transporter ExbD [Synergistaceae bacterium]
MKKARRRGNGADIDITPLIDILFMLIIFFVLASTFIQGRLTVDLPQGTGEPVNDGNPFLVTLTREGKVFWADFPQPVTSEDLYRLVRENAGKREILVAGDRDAPYGEVAGLLDELQSAGAERVGLVLRGKSRTASRTDVSHESTPSAATSPSKTGSAFSHVP